MFLPIRMMTRDVLLALLLSILPFSLLSSSNSAESDPLLLFTYCNENSTSYTLNSTFGNNLKHLLQALPGYTLSSSGFNNTSVGENQTKVNGQALCRGDINSSVCQNCVKTASQEIQKECKNEDAIIWYQYCQVRYSFQDFFTSSVYTGKYPQWNIQEKNASNPVSFYKYVDFLMNNISDKAAHKSSQLMFATGEVKYSGNETIYGLVQCTRDITEDQCSNCLSSAVNELDACCYGKQGGIILSRNCNVRFELYSFYNASSNLLKYPTPKRNNWKTWLFVLVAILVLAVISLLFLCLRQRQGTKKDEEISQNALLQELATPRGFTVTQGGNLVSSDELPSMDLFTLRTATNNFSDTNKLGQGGFGTVYKGILPDGKEIAIKRLSRKSWQGLEELRTEIILIARLQHRNLVRLLGCAIEEDEKLLIYEFMPNRSLDTFIFDSKKRVELDWNTCYHIILGIARGLLYLHEESRLKIIHRDLKPNNLLLDNEMVVKISDFGMARIFGENQNTANTKRVVGTYGYMAPEYAMEGLFSVKSDVFSFGVILLEIISGKKNSSFYLTGYAQTLLAYVWQLYNEGKELEMVEPTLLERAATAEIVKCIHIGLLCVQEDPGERPPMSSVVSLLGSGPVLLPRPKQPAFSVAKLVPVEQSSSADPFINQITVSDLVPR